MKRKILIGLAMATILMLVATPLTALADNIPQTTLSATISASGHWMRVFNWTIDKSVTPETLDLFRGDNGTAFYTIALTKTVGSDSFYTDGSICVTNGGAYATTNLAISVGVQYNINDGNGYQSLMTTAVDVSSKPILGAGETHCYPYTVFYTPIAGAKYRNVAHVTITNHAGWIPTGHSPNCPGPALCPFGPNPKVGFSLPGAPDILIRDQVTVTDTNGGSWTFNNSGSVGYGKVFTCDADEGNNPNTAAIVETGQSDGANVHVNCYALTVDKTASTSFTRTYNWIIYKWGNTSFLTLARNQIYLASYTVGLSATYTDSNWAMSGTITVSNPAPMAASLAGVSDLIDGTIAASVDCPSLTVPAGGTLECTYQAALPDAAARTNVATASLQNNTGSTTAFTTVLGFDFSGAAITYVDESVVVGDSMAGRLGEVTYGVDALPKTFLYNIFIGPYTNCGSYDFVNTATFTANDTGATGSANWTVKVTVPCSGCTLTIGYWKNHAGFGPQNDMVSQYLPMYVGGVYVGTPAQAVFYLGMSGNASNGINKLIAQLLGAKLNIANGADGSAVASVIAQANAFLSTHPASSWSTLSKANRNKVLNWMTTLDSFNNGYIGPGHCSP